MEKPYSAVMSDAIKGQEWRERLRLLLEERGLSKRKVSLGAGLGPGAIHSWLVEGKDPSLANLLSVCEFLNVSLIYLVKGYALTPEAEEILGLLEGSPETREGILAILRARRPGAA